MQPQNNFPAIASPPFGPTSYGLTVFQPDTVLTAAQLNEWFSFVMAQEQATRTRLLGVGVATGLRPSLAPDGSTITVSAGCGLSSEGHLLRLETAQTYTGFVAYTAPAPEVYPALSGLTLLELRPAGEGGQPLTNLNLTTSQYAVVVFQKSGILPAEHCMGLDCNDKSDTYDTRLQVLLVKQANAIDRLLKPGPVQAAAAYAKLPVLALRRPLLTDATYLGRFQALKDVLQQAAATFGDALLRAAALVQNIDGFKQQSPDFLSISSDALFAKSIDAAPEKLGVLSETRNFSTLLSRTRGRLTYVDQWRQQLISRVTTLTSDANAQYVYDWLKDLYDAYEEFRQATAAPAWLGVAMPAADAFPRHLVLGELVPDTGLQAPQYRHAWQPAPSSSLAADAPARGLWLFQRLGSLISQFSVPALASSGGSSGGISVADQIRKQDLLERLQQEQLDIFVKEQTATAGTSMLTASAEKGAETSLYSLVRQDLPTRDEFLRPLYEFPAEPVVTSQIGVPALRLVPDRARSAGFDQRSLPFYYAPAMRAGWSYARTTSSQTSLILSYNAATDAPIHVSQPLDYQLEGYDFYRVEGLLDAPAAAVLVRLLRLRQQYNLPFDVVAVCADPPSTSQPLLTPLNEQYFADQEVEFDDLLLQLQADETRLTIAKPFSGQLRMSTTAFKTAADTYTAATPALKPRVDLLVALNAAYQSRLALLSTQLSFGPFAQANPGLEHGAGVPRGGTLVLVYRTMPADTATPVVVGDYYLPYRLGGRGPVVQFTLPVPPPSVAIEQNPVNVLDKTVRLSVSPAGGTFDRLVKQAIDGTYYFDPTSLVIGASGYSTQKLTYTINDGGAGQKAELNVVVFGPPRVDSFTASVDTAGVATFSYDVRNATQLLIDFGDGTSETFTLPATPSQNGTGEYKSKFATADDPNVYFFKHKYAATQNRYPKLTATHGNQKVSQGLTLTFDNVAVALTSDDNVVLQGVPGVLYGSPIGGVYSSATLVDTAGKPLSSSGAYVATKAGQHQASYTYGNKPPVSFSLFAVPNDFPIDELDFSGGTITGTVTLPKLPDGIVYQWQFNGKLSEEEATLVPTGDYATVTYKFFIEGVDDKELAAIPLRLIVFDIRQSIMQAAPEPQAMASLVAQDDTRFVAVKKSDGVIVTIDHILFTDLNGNPTR